MIFGRDATLAGVRREALARGLRAATPAMLPTAIWGLVAGVAMIKTGLTPVQAVAMTLLVYSGSAQMASLPLIGAGAPVWVALLAATIVNLRFIIFSATLAPYFGRLPMRPRLLLGYVSADISLAIFMARYADAPVEQRGNTEQRWYYAGIAGATWLSWQPMSIVGVLLAGTIPGAWGLEFGAILALIVLTVPMFRGRPAIAGCVTAGIVSVAVSGLPLNLGLLIAVIAGVAVAMSADLLAERSATGHAP